MFELTSTPYRFRNALAEGNLWDALGLARGASKLDVDVAGARLAEQVPTMAQEVSKVVNVLTHGQRRVVYEAVCKLCDDVIGAFQDRLGPEFATSFSDYRQDLWQRCCRLFRFDPGIENQVLGPKGMDSLVRSGRDWVIHDFLAARVAKVSFAAHEWKAGLARRDVWWMRCSCGQAAKFFYALRTPAPAGKKPGENEDEQPPETFKAEDYDSARPCCARCRASNLTPLRFEERFEFSFPAKAGRGKVLRGRPVFGGSAVFVVISEVAGSSVPQALLDRFFVLQEEGKDVKLGDIRLATPPRPRPAKSRQSGSNSNSETGGRILVGIIAGVVSLALAAVNHDSHQTQPSRPYQIPPPIPKWPPPKIDTSPWERPSSAPQWPPARTGYPLSRSTGFLLPWPTEVPPPQSTDFPLPRSSDFPLPRSTGFLLPRPTGFPSIPSFPHGDKPSEKSLPDGGRTEDVLPDIIKPDVTKKSQVGLIQNFPAESQDAARNGPEQGTFKPCLARALFKSCLASFSSWSPFKCSG